MAKECIVCGYQPDPPAKPAGENENCPKCRAQGSVQDIERAEDEE